MASAASEQPARLRGPRRRAAAAGRQSSGSSGREKRWAAALACSGGARWLLALDALRRAGAAGQTYTVVQCHPLNRAHANAILEDASPYAARSFCGDPQNDYAIKVTSTRDAQHGGFGRVRWTTGSPALGIVSVDLRAKLRRDNRQHRAPLDGRPALERGRRGSPPATAIPPPTGTTAGTPAAMARVSSSPASRANDPPAAGSPTSRRPGCETSGSRWRTTSDPSFTALSGSAVGWQAGFAGLAGLHALGEDLGQRPCRDRRRLSMARNWQRATATANGPWHSLCAPASGPVAPS